MCGPVKVRVVWIEFLAVLVVQLTADQTIEANNVSKSIIDDINSCTGVVEHEMLLAA